MPADVAHLLMAWHSNIHYRIHHNQDSRSFRATRGIRQGCSIAPLLWLVFSHEVSCALAEKVGMDTIARVLTIFADDYLVADTFSSVAELEALLDIVQALFRTLETFGMEVSDQKSKAVLALRGTLSNSVRRRFIRGNPKGEGKVLRLHTKGGALCIPLAQQITYLGTQICYHHFERLTLESRLAKAEIAYNRLGSVLKGRHHLSTSQRVSLWRSCVWATAQHGLTACGLTQAGLHSLEVTMLRQLRAILRQPVHLAHSTNQQVCRDAGVPLPHQILQQLMWTERTKHGSLPEDPFVCSPLSEWWKHVYASLEPAGSASLIPVHAHECDTHVCSHCGVAYQSGAALKRHIIKQHPEIGKPTHPHFTQLRDSVDGLPKCKHCEKCFPTWQLLQRHIQGGYCSARPTADPSADHALLSTEGPKIVAGVKFACHPDISTILHTYKTNAVLYVQRCLLCGQWLASSKIVKTHYKGSHPKEYQHHKQAVKLCGTFAGCGSPCLYCGVVTKQPRHHKAQCSVLWQFCVLTLQQPASTETHLCHGSGSGTRRTVWVTGGQASQGFRKCPPGGHDNVSGRAPLQGSETGQRQARSPAVGGQPALHSFWGRRQPSEGRQGRSGPSLHTDPPENHGETPATPGNQHSDPQAELGLGCLSAARSAGPPATPVQGIRDLPSGGQIQAYGLPVACPAAEYLVPDGSAVHQEHQGKPGTTSGGSESWMDHERRPMGLPEVGPSGPSPCCGRGEDPSRASGTGHAAGSDGSGGKSEGCCAQVQRDIPDHGRPAQHGQVHAGDWAKGEGSGRCLDRARGPAGTGGPTGCGDAAPTRWTTTIEFGRGPPEDAERVVRLVLRNPSQHCYINSFALAWLWAFCLLEAPDAQFFGSFPQAWRDILYNQQPLTIYRLASWTRLFRGWQSPASQHDVVEFIVHLFSRMQPLALGGEWQAKLGIGGTQAIAVDSGSLTSPIILHLRGDGNDDTLQGCIDRWHQQAYLHGLKEAYPVVLLQLPRYSFGTNGASKDRSGIVIDKRVFLPVFGRGLTTFRATYLVCSIIVHHGVHTHSGHYTSLLLEPGALHRNTYWGTDDGKAAKSYGRMPKCVERDAYVLILIRCRFPAAMGSNHEPLSRGS